MSTSLQGGARNAFLSLLIVLSSPSIHALEYYFESRDIFPLTSSSVTCLAEDDRGSLWIGTHRGILVYDGRNARRLDRGNLAKLPADDILSLDYVDALGEIWIGTVAGAVRYDLLEEKARKLSVKYEAGRDAVPEFHRIESLPDGRVFAIARDGIFASDRGDPFERQGNPDDPESSREYRDLAVGGSGCVWAVSDAGLECWDPETGEFVLEAELSDALSLDVMGNSVWIGTAGSGVYRFDAGIGGLERYGVPGDATTMIVGPDGTIWAGSPSDGISIVDPINGSVEKVDIDAEHPYRLSSGLVTAMMRGLDGHIWIGTADAGLLSVDVRKKNHLNFVRRSGPVGLPAGQVRVVLEDSLGYVWAGSGIGGLSRFDPEFGETRHYVHSPEDFLSIPSNRITAMLEDGTGRLWVGTDKGPSIYLPEVDGFEPPGDMMGGWPDFSGKHVLSLAESSDGYIWISFRDGEVYRLDSMDRDYRTYRFVPASAVPSVLFADRYGSIWAGSRMGLRLYNEEGSLVKTWTASGLDKGGIPKGGVAALFVDSTDHLWLGGPTGLAIYRAEMREFEEIDPPGGEAMDVAGILEDGAGRIWVVDGGKVHLFTRRGEHLTSMSVDSGFTPTGMVSGISLGGDGTVRLGANGEIWSFDGIPDPPESPKPRVFLTELKVFDETIANGRKLEEEGSVSLTPGENMFSIGFGAVDFRYRSRISYQYKLLGYHDEWIDNGANDSVIYAKLPPGRYDFILRAYNDAGDFSNEASLGIKVDPAFWRTPLAIAVYVAILASLVAMIVKLREGQLLKAQVRELEEARMKVLEANRKLEFLTMNDSLTGLLNRRGFDQAIGHALTTAGRNGLMITLFMMDVDFFKAYNDNYGHVRGDEVLRGVGKALRGVFERSTDIIARYGGEEFTVVFIGDNPNASVTLANDLILAIEDLGIKHEYSSASELLTLSIGSATIRVSGDVTVGNLIDTADRALYAGKAGGRNKTCFTGIIPELPERMKNGTEPMILEPEKMH